MIASIPNMKLVESDRICAVYDAKTGRIHHLHRVITLKGGPSPSPAEIEARAIELAMEKGKSSAKFKTLHLSPEQLHPGARHKVDPKTGSLISKPVKERK